MEVKTEICEPCYQDCPHYTQCHEIDDRIKAVNDENVQKLLKAVFG